MVKKLFFLACVLGLGVALHAADEDSKRRLHASAPAGQGDAIQHRNSAPARLSNEYTRTDDSSLVGLDQGEQENKNIKQFYSSSPVQPSKGTSQPFASKQLCFMTADMYDDFLLETIDRNRRYINAVAIKHNLKSSRFYQVIKGMRSELIQADAHINILANYFLFTIIKHDSFKACLKVESDILKKPGEDFSECVVLIRGCLNKVTKKGIQWPTTPREESKELYYKELLEKNSDIVIPDVNLAYYGAMVATYCLMQIAQRSDDLKKRFLGIADSKTLTKKHLKMLEEKLCEMGRFVPSLHAFYEKKHKS